MRKQIIAAVAAAALTYSPETQARVGNPFTGVENTQSGKGFCEPVENFGRGAGAEDYAKFTRGNTTSPSPVPYSPTQAVTTQASTNGPVLVAENLGE